MATLNTGYSSQSERWAVAPATRAYDVPVGVLKRPTRAISVSEDTTITAVFSDQDAEFTTHTLIAGQLYPFAIKELISVATGNVKGYS